MHAGTGNTNLVYMHVRVNNNCLSCCTYAVSSMEFPSFEIKTEADSNDINECSQDDEPSTGHTGMSSFTDDGSLYITRLLIHDCCIVFTQRTVVEFIDGWGYYYRVV